MKTTIWKSFLRFRRFQLTALALFLLVAACPAQAQYTLTGSGNTYNFFASNGLAFLLEGVDPSSPLSGSPLPGPIVFSTPSYPESGPIPATGPVTVNATVVNGSATFTLGTDPTGSGTVITLNNPNTTPSEVRLDWLANYTYTGSGTSIPHISAAISATLGPSGSYYALGGGEIISDGEANSPFTAQFQNTFTNNYASFLPTGLGVNGPWFGFFSTGAGTYNATAYANFYDANLNLNGPTFQNNDTLTVQGYLDLVVDPGNVQINLGPVPPPALGIGTYSNAPVVFFPSNPGTNYLLQGRANLLPTNWMTVTNGVMFTAVQVTNAPGPVFFRLH